MNDPTPVSVIARALEQLTDYLRTGRALPAHRAAVLLERLSRDAEADARIRVQVGQLAEVLCHRLNALPKSSMSNITWMHGDLDAT
jgi:hypothetical protein